MQGGKGKKVGGKKKPLQKNESKIIIVKKIKQDKDINKLLTTKTNKQHTFFIDKKTKKDYTLYVLFY